jgi:S1-C subfamily serine protease
VNTGVGFAIPVNILKIVAPALIENGSYQWPWLGVSGMSVNPTIAEANQLESERGAYILQVVQGSPADQAGLQGVSEDLGGEQGFVVPTGGDVIVEVDGEAIESYDELLTLIAFKHPGDTMDLVVLRNGERLNLMATLEPRP